MFRNSDFSNRIEDQLGLFDYKPNTSPVVSSKDIVLQSGAGQGIFKTKRNLTSDEYQFYYTYMRDSNNPMAVRIGVAMGLKADLIRMYPSFLEDQKDTEIDNLLEYFPALSLAEQDRAKSEAYYFDQMVSTTPEVVAGSTDLETMALANRPLWLQQVMSEKLKMATDAAIKQAQEDAINATKDEEAQKSIESRRNEWDTAQGKRMEAFIKQNVKDYLDTVMIQSVLSQGMNDVQAQMQQVAKDEIVRQVQEGTLDPLNALSAYKMKLDEITLYKSPLKAFVARNNLNVFQNPMLAYMRPS